MSSRILNACAALVALLALTSATFGQGRITQTYSQWELRRSTPVELAGGVSLTLTYQQCTFVAKDETGAVVRKDVCRYFLNDPRPQDGVTEACNHWVYWLRTDKDPANPVLWARCPTPKHPEYKQLTRTLGPDLWELIPPNERKPNPTLQSMHGKYGDTFAAKPGSAPLVDPKVKVTIDCINFQNEVFR